MNKPNTETKKEVKNVVVESVEVTRAKVMENGKVTFDMVVNGITIYGCFVVEYSKGDFISLPQRKGTDGNYYNVVYARFSKEDTDKIIKLVESKLV